MTTLNSRYKILLETINLKSLTKVAEKTGYTQSGISHILNALEKEWGITLVRRNHNGSIVTPEGKQLLPYIIDVLHAEEALHEHIESIKGLEAGLIRIGSFSSVSLNLLPHIIQSFQKLHPYIHFEILHGDYSEIESWIMNGLADIGFLRLPLKDSFDYLPFYKDTIFAILPEDQRSKNTEYISLEELEQSPFIMLDMGELNDYQNYFDNHGIKPNIRYTAREDAVVMAMVESHLGIGLCYELSFRRNPYRIYAKQLEAPAQREIVIATKKGQRRSLAVESFLSFVDTYQKSSKAI